MKLATPPRPSAKTSAEAYPRLARSNEPSERQFRGLPCPQCGHREFNRYVTSRGVPFPAPEVGRCERLNNCGYHFRPSDYFRLKGGMPEFIKNKPQTATKKPEPSVCFVRPEIVLKSLQFELFSARKCALTQWLIGRYGERAVLWACALYGWGVTRDPSEVVWWHYAPDLRDPEGHALRVHTGKVMRYRADGHRDKSGKGVTWAHTRVPELRKAVDAGTLRAECGDIYGAWLLGSQYSDPSGRVYLAESEKTAVVMALERCQPDPTAWLYQPSGVFQAPRLPEVWLGGIPLSWLSGDRLETLRRAVGPRELWLVPDADGADTWISKAETLRHEFPSLGVIDIRQLGATGKEDIADLAVSGRAHLGSVGSSSDATPTALGCADRLRWGMERSNSQTSV